ncbi:uncharacterized protein LOC134240616 [Saccostrea cucullata]|uniref:uncharacterized protein LOC134240616 n=1 Tax=Saccostrea cuccullata TaxID=36930 RepID=UPI002ED02767
MESVMERKMHRKETEIPPYLDVKINLLENESDKKIFEKYLEQQEGIELSNYHERFSLRSSKEQSSEPLLSDIIKPSDQTQKMQDSVKKHKFHEKETQMPPYMDEEINYYEDKKIMEDSLDLQKETTSLNHPERFPHPLSRMQASKFLSTMEKEYYHRILKLLKDTCLNLFRVLLKTHFSIGEFSLILKMYRTPFINILNEAERGLLYPKSGIIMVKFNDLDLPLLHKLCEGLPWKDLIYYACDQSSIYRIKEILDSFCEYQNRMILSDQEFHMHLDDILHKIHGLERVIPRHKTKYREALCIIRTGITDLAKEKGFINSTAEKFQCTGNKKLLKVSYIQYN